MMDGTSFWMDLDDGQPELTADERSRQLEVEVSSLRRELAEVRKELAAKTVQLSKRDQNDRAAQEKWAEQRAAELAAAAALPKEQRINALEQSVVQLEITLAKSQEELEEARRLYTSQKRALKDALSAAAERDAAEVAAGESGLEAATAAAEEEVERLTQELAQVRTRTALEIKAKEAEVAELQQQLSTHAEAKLAAVAAAEAAVADAAEARLAGVTSEQQARVMELQAEVQRLRSSAQSYLRDEREDMADQLAAVNKANVQLQREFDAFKDLTAQTSRQHREEQARLLEENASLKSRIAAEAARVAMGVLPGAGVGRPVAKTFAAVGEPGSMGGAVDAWLGKIERQRKGLVPVLVVSSLILLVLLIAVVRAAASAHEDQRGVICFLSKLGVQIGGGCSSSSSSTSQLMSAGASKAAVSKVLGELVEATPRVRDIEPHIPTGASILKADGTVVAAAAGAAANANATDGGAQLGMRLLRAWWLP